MKTPLLTALAVTAIFTSACNRAAEEPTTKPAAPTSLEPLPNGRVPLPTQPQTKGEQIDAATAQIALCVQQNLMPENEFINVVEDGMTISYGRRYWSTENQTWAQEDSKVYVDLFMTRGVKKSSGSGYVFIPVSQASKEDVATIAVMENCVRDAMPTALNYDILKPLPAPEGYRPYSQLIGPPNNRP